MPNTPEQEQPKLPDLHRLFFERIHETSRDQSSSLITMGQGAIRAILLVNGGACVTMLAFLGHVFSNETQELPRELVLSLTDSLFWFIFGTTLGVIAAVTAYISQSRYTEVFNKQSADFLVKLLKNIHPGTIKSSISGLVLVYVTISLGIIAMLMFVYGASVAYLAFSASALVK